MFRLLFWGLGMTGWGFRGLEYDNGLRPWNQGSALRVYCLGDSYRSRGVCVCVCARAWM